MRHLGGVGAAAALLVALSACGGGTGAPAVAPAALTVTVGGVPGAPVTVREVASGATVFEGRVEGSRVVPGVRAGSTLRVNGADVDGFVAAPVEVTVTGDTAATLAYVPSSALLDPALLQGTVVGSKLGAGALFLTSDTGVSRTNRGTLSDGNVVSLPLLAAPEADSLVPLLPVGCRLDGAASAAPRVSIWTGAAVFTAAGDRMARVTERLRAEDGGALVERVFSDRAASVTGELTCGGTVTAVDVTLTAGWNVLTLGTVSGRVTLRSAPAGARAVLTSEAATPGVELVFAPTLSFGDNETVVVPVDVLQVGGLSGTVSLATDVPGLTVEPGTVTLPALTGQGLGALGLGVQRVTTSLTFRYMGGDAQGPFHVIVRDAQGRDVGRAAGQLSVVRSGLTLTSYDEVTVPVSGRGSVTVATQASGNVQGPVTFSVVGLPAGVQSDPVTVTVARGGAVYPDVLFTADRSAKPGRSAVVVRATSGARTWERPITLVVPQPRVIVNATTTSQVGLYQNEDAFVEADVSSTLGFDGATTLSVAGLPAGVTGETKTVLVSPGSTTRVRLNVRASATAVLGTPRVTVTTPDLLYVEGDYPYHSLWLSVRPARTAVPFGSIAVPAVAAATGDVWQLVSSTASEGVTEQPTSVIALTRADGTSGTVTVPVSVQRLVGTSDGVVALELSPGSRNLLIRHDLTVQDLPSAGIVSGDTTAPRTDAVGQVWFVHWTLLPSGYSTSDLKVWDPVTGTVTTVVANGAYGSSDGQFVLSADGQVLCFVPARGAAVTRIDAGTRRAGVLPVMGVPASNVALDDQHRVWYGSYSQLTRLNADGTKSLFSVEGGEALVGFDAAQPGILWTVTGSDFRRVDTTDRSSRLITVSDDYYAKSAPFIRPGGGVTVITYDTEPGSRQAVVSVVK